MGNCLHNVARTRLALCAYHGSTLAYAAERFAKIFSAAYERHFKLSLVDMVNVVGGREHLRFVDVVDLDSFEYLRLSEMTYTALRHYGDRYRLLYALYHLRVAHAGNAACRANVGWYTLKRHNCARACRFGYLCLLGGGNVHDNAALQHLGEVFVKLILLAHSVFPHFIF